MTNIDRAFTVTSGLSIDDIVGVFYSDVDPTVGGEAAPVGSLLLQTSGELFQKFDTNDVDWQRVLTTADMLDLPALQVRDTIGNANVPVVWTDLNFNATDIENQPSIIEHDNIDTDRLTVFETGMYMLSYSFSCDDELQVRARINDTTVIPGSTKIAGDANDVNDVVVINSSIVLVQLVANDYITIQIQSATTTEQLLANGTVQLVRLKGVRGDTGPAGVDGIDGTGLVNIENNGSPLTGQYGTINFIGPEITASNAGSNVTNVTINNVFGAHYTYATSDTVTTTTSTTFQEKVSITTPNLPSGVYRLGWMYMWNHDSNTNDFRARIQQNNSTNLFEHYQEPSEVGGVFGATGTDQRFPACGFTHLSLSGIHTFDLDFSTQTSPDESSMWDARLEFWRVS